jgi:hypothetical protein
VDLPQDFWDGAAVVAAIVVPGLLWWLTHRGEKERHAFAKESFEWDKRIHLQESLPKLRIELHNAGYFSGYGMLREGDNYRLSHPDPWIAPIPFLSATISNVGRVPIALYQAGIRLERTGAEMQVPREREIATVEGESAFPTALQPRTSTTLSLDWPLLKRMLDVLKADEGDVFDVWLEDGTGTKYRSPSRSASDILSGFGSLELAVHFESPVTITEIGEEEYIPEGLIPGSKQDHDDSRS